MSISSILIAGMWSGLFAGCLGLLLTSPVRNILSASVCGFAGRLSRDLLMNSGLNQNWSTVVAAAIVVLVAAVLIRKREVSPVVLITGVLPLGATVAMFNMISELMRVSSLTGDSLNVSSVAFVSNMGKVFTTSLAIAVGLAGGIFIAELLRRDRTSV